MPDRPAPLVVLTAICSLTLCATTSLFAGEPTPYAPPCWRWEEMLPRDLETALADVPVAYMVVSPVEWHGEAMAFGTDPIIGTSVAEQAWRKTGGVMIPTLYLGAETEYKDWDGGLTSYWGLEWNTKQHNPGSLYIRPTTLELVVREMLEHVEKQGFKICVVMTGHGATEHVRVLRDLEDRWEKRPMTVLFRKYPKSTRKRPQGLGFPGSGSHADFAEASNLGGVDSAYVDRTVFGIAKPDQATGLFHKNAPKIDFEKGRRGLEFRALRVADAVNALLGKPVAVHTAKADDTWHKRISCGALHGFRDSEGHIWEGDRVYTTTVSRADRGEIEITGTSNANIYRTEAFSLDSGYTFDVPKGAYDVVLHFAETWQGTEKTGQRVMDVSLNGKKVLEGFDVFKESGKKRNAAVVETFEANAPDGTIRLAFASETDNAIINGIELIAKDVQ